MKETIEEKLAYLRGEIEAERISQGELLELQSLVEHIDPSDVLLLEWAGVSEGGDTSEATATHIDDDGRSWYRLNGVDRGTGCEFSGDVYGVTADGAILDADGCPLTDGDVLTVAVRNAVRRL